MNRQVFFSVILLLGGCSKPHGSGAAPSASAPATLAGAGNSAFLRAELRRAPSEVTADDAIAVDVTRRSAAVRALARIEDDASFETLAKALYDEEPSVLGWAAFGVGQLCHGHEPEAVRRLVLRAASLAAGAPSAALNQARANIALALGACASDEAEKTLRGWLEQPPPIGDAAALGLAHQARLRRRLDDATIATLLDVASKAPGSSALHAIESLPTLGSAARQRLVEVASAALEKPSPGRGFAVRALAKAGPDAAPALRRLLEAADSNDAERADAARSLAALGSAGQSDLAAALALRARALLDTKAWLTSAHGVVLTLLEGLEPKSADPALLKELAQLPLDGEPPPLARRKVMLRCRAAQLLALQSPESALLTACDPAPPAERREGSLAELKVLARGSLDKARGARFQALARSSDRVVREAALELLVAHDEVANAPELLQSALSAAEIGVRATAAKLLAQYPARAKDDDKTATPNPGVVSALTQQLAQVTATSNEIELAGWLLDAAVALQLLGAKPALERACGSSNVTLRKHAEKGFARLGEPQRRCSSVAGQATFEDARLAAPRIDFTTDAGPLTITLWSDVSPFASARFVELTRSGFFDGLLVHRVVPGFVVQFGDPDGDGFGGAKLPTLPCQVGPESFEVGSVGVALAGRDTGVSQFFVALRNAPHLAGEYSQIGKAGPGWEKLAAGDRILTARVLEAGAK